MAVSAFTASVRLCHRDGQGMPVRRGAKRGGPFQVVRENTETGEEVVVRSNLGMLDAERVAGSLRDLMSEREAGAGWNYIHRHFKQGPKAVRAALPTSPLYHIPEELKAARRALIAMREKVRRENAWRYRQARRLPLS